MMSLDQLLGNLDVGIKAFAVCELRRGASLVLQEEEATIHYVLSGSAIAQSAIAPSAASPILLTPHTVVVMPPGSRLVVSSDTGTSSLAIPMAQCRPLPGGWDWNSYGEGETGLVLVCGTVAAWHRETNGLFDYLRAPLVENVAHDAAFEQPFRRLLDELSAPSAGTKTLSEILMKECLIALLRRHCERGECRAPWLAALEHPRLAAAIGAMLDRPARPFTLESLAEIAGMSRAAFAERFKAAFARTPMAFLKDIRLRRAADLLTGSDLPVKAVAARVGFASRSHFSSAFKAYAGADPASYRATASGLGRLG